MKQPHEKTNRHTKHPIVYISILLAVLSMLAGIFLPEILLKRRADAEISVVKNASETYYLAAETAMAKNASQQLSALDRIKLASGTWESTSFQTTPGSDNLTESEAVTLAKQQMDHYSQYGIYPYSFSSSYDNWYSWTTEFYEYTDNVFQTYTTYVWVIHFTRFDGTLKHTIVMTENGTILAAEANVVSHDFYPLRTAYVNSDPATLLGDEKVSLYSLSYNMDVSNTDMESIHIEGYPYIDMTDANIENLYEIKLSVDNSEPEPYYIYQYTTDHSYGFGIVPKE